MGVDGDFPSLVGCIDGVKKSEEGGRRKEERGKGNGSRYEDFPMGSSRSFRTEGLMSLTTLFFFFFPLLFLFSLYPYSLRIGDTCHGPGA